VVIGVQFSNAIFPEQVVVGPAEHEPLQEFDLADFALDDPAEDVTWLHGFMTRLAGAGFPSPRSLPCFDGMSWIVAGGWLWEIVSFLPGHAVGWAAVPPMEEVRALLGHYHVAVRQIQVTGQRPSALPLAEVPPVLLSHQLEAIPS